jgi:heme-degrading monooxygenase HmoA
MDAERAANRPTVARIWRGRTRPEVADEYEAYNFQAGIRPLIEKALGVQTFREDRETETEFMTISYWASVEDMAVFTGGDPRRVHLLDRDPEYLIELPTEVQILRLLTSHGDTGSGS